MIFTLFTFKAATDQLESRLVNIFDIEVSTYRGVYRYFISRAFIFTAISLHDSATRQHRESVIKL